MRVPRYFITDGKNIPLGMKMLAHADLPKINDSHNTDVKWEHRTACVAVARDRRDAITLRRHRVRLQPLRFRLPLNFGRPRRDRHDRRSSEWEMRVSESVQGRRYRDGHARAADTAGYIQWSVVQRNLAWHKSDSDRRTRGESGGADRGRGRKGGDGRLRTRGRGQMRGNVC